MSSKPFALILGPSLSAASPAAFEAGFRRMGLKPERAVGDGDATPRYRLHFGGVAATIARAGEAELAEADPHDPATSSLATSLPADWRAGGGCWALWCDEEATSVQAPAMRASFQMMVLLLDLFDASHVFWPPARLWSDAPQFRAAMAEMLVSGMPPVLHLVAFRRGEKGGEAVVRTRGLMLFAGQEIEAPIPAGWTIADLVKRVARLALDLMLNGPLLEAQETRGLQPGETVRLRPPDRGDATPTVRAEFGRGG
ncbi:hypothetical protein [Sphingopyxis indica]|uniref:hypothetical protein n=1 Tax=Sphingopyxis indica TaxID=436663 RepID=UPI00112FFFE7|nr:hypothetical protein [Sphingopyxis indica]